MAGGLLNGPGRPDSALAEVYRRPRPRWPIPSPTRVSPVERSSLHFVLQRASGRYLHRDGRSCSRLTSLGIDSAGGQPVWILESVPRSRVQVPVARPQATSSGEPDFVTYPVCGEQHVPVRVGHLVAQNWLEKFDATKRANPYGPAQAHGQ